MNENQVPNQDNLTSMNTTSNLVPPISEVKIEASSDDTVTNQNKNQEEKTSIPFISANDSSGKSSNEPPKNNKASTILLVLLFLFFFAFIMGMPYIHDFIHKLKSDIGLSEIEQAAKREEEKQKQEEESKKTTSTLEEDKMKELVCRFINTTLTNYTLTETQTFYYNSKNEVLQSKLVLAYNFVAIDDSYQSLKQQCGEDSLKYLTQEGYTMACSYGDSNIEISHEFDLEKFTPIVDSTTNIQANATYQQDVNTIKNNLISQGYTCQ